MKKLIVVITTLAALAAGAYAQDVDLESLEDLNKIEISKEGAPVSTELRLAFPMYFGASVLTQVDYRGEWAAFAPTKFLDMQTAKNFVYGLQLADLHIQHNLLDVSFGLRWTFMDFTFTHPELTLRGSKVMVPSLIVNERADYDGKKSKIHASYFGVPVRVGLDFGRAEVYVGASAEFLTGGYTKYKHPKYRQKVEGVFNPFRATVEGGFSYGNLGVFVMYGLTPLFREELSSARTFTFGLLLGL